MEIELKYLIENEETQQRIWNEAVFQKYGTVDMRPDTEMLAVYFDTPDGILSRVDAAFRIRKENERVVATLKWGGTNKDALHEREELNISLCGEAETANPSLAVFAESERGRELIELVGDREMIPTVEMRFLRKVMMADTGETIFEAALDTGKIVTNYGEAEIRELELELFSGNIAELEKIGDDLAKRFSLIPGIKSKYARGIEMNRKSV